MMIPLLLLLAAPPQTNRFDTPQSVGLVEKARERLAAEQRCVVDPDSTDITVCGLRRADRFRVTFVVPEAGDPRHEGVNAERARLLNKSNPVKDLSPFLVEGGLSGVSMGVTFGASGSSSFVRKPAP